MKILENLQNIHLFGKIREFNFCVYFLKKKEKSLKNILKINKELIAFYKNNIVLSKKDISISSLKISNLEDDNVGIKESIEKINKVKDI